APLPDLVNAFILGNSGPGVQLVSLSFRADAKGLVHDPAGQQPDQPGSLVVSQTGVLARGGGHFVGDFGFAAEVVHIQPAGAPSPPQASMAVKAAGVGPQGGSLLVGEFDRSAEVLDFLAKEKDDESWAL